MSDLNKTYEVKFNFDEVKSLRDILTDEYKRVKYTPVSLDMYNEVITRFECIKSAHEKLEEIIYSTGDKHED